MIRFHRICRFDDTVVLRVRARGTTGLVDDNESHITQTFYEASLLQPLHDLDRGSLGFVQVQHGYTLTIPKLNQFCMVSKVEYKIKRTWTFELHRILAFDLARVGHIKYGQPGTMSLLNIENLSAVACIVKQHCLASVLRQFGKIRGAHEDDFVRRMVPRFRWISECESRYSREG